MRLLKYAAYAALAVLVLAATGAYAFYRSLLPRDLPRRPALTSPALVRGAVRAFLGTAAREETARAYLDRAEEQGEFAGDGYQKRRMRVAALRRWLGHWSDDEVAEAFAALVRHHTGFGLAAAANALFGRPLQQLTPDEVALVVVVAWSARSPDPACDPAKASDARNRLLARMADAQLIGPNEMLKLQATPIPVLPPCPQGR